VPRDVSKPLGDIGRSPTEAALLALSFQRFLHDSRAAEYGLLSSSSRKSCDLWGHLDAPERICSHFFPMLPGHVDPSACKFRNDGEKFNW
jgi:hypothetical protein